MTATGGKAADALRTIGEVAAETGVATHVLRYWERTVPTLKPMRSSGRRYYRPDDVSLVRRLHHLVSVEGYTLEGAAKALGRRSAALPEQQRLDLPEPAQSQAAAGAIPADSLERLKHLRDRLNAALAA